MQLLRSAVLWVWLVVAGPNCHSFTTGHQLQVRVPVWDVGGLITQVTGYMKGQDTARPPKKKERPHHEEHWPPYGYYDPALMYPPYYYPYPPYPPPTNPPWPTKGTTKMTTKKPKPPTTKKPPETTTKPPTMTTTKPPTVTTTGVTTTETPSTTTETPSTTTETPSTTTETPSTTTETPSTTTETPSTTTEVTTTEGTTDATTTSPPGRDLCQIYPLLPECRAIKSVQRKKDKHSSNVLQPDQKLSVETKPHSVTSLCFYYPRLCMRPEEAQFVSLSDENGRPLLLISPVDKKSVKSQG